MGRAVTCETGFMSTATVTLDDVERARELLEGVARRTPLEGSRTLSERVGGPVRFKCENLQRTGSFKIRGAYVRIASLDPAERARGVVAASAGNHAPGRGAGGVAAGQPVHGVHAGGRAAAQGRGDRGLRRDVRFAGHTVDEALVAASEFAERDRRGASSTPSTTRT